MKKACFQLTTSESILVLAGLLFFASTVFVATGGDYTLLLTAKIVYGVGVVILIAGK